MRPVHTTDEASLMHILVVYFQGGKMLYSMDITGHKSMGDHISALYLENEGANQQKHSAQISETICVSLNGREELILAFSERQQLLPDCLSFDDSGLRCNGM